jgi:hypothetical protein
MILIIFGIGKVQIFPLETFTQFNMPARFTKAWRQLAKRISSTLSAVHGLDLKGMALLFGVVTSLLLGPVSGISWLQASIWDWRACHGGRQST